MGKLIYGMNVSLDGFIETPDHGLEWTVIDEEVHGWFNDLTRSLDASLYGRRLWELMAGHWPTAAEDPTITDVERDFAQLWNTTPKIVFSTTLEHVDPPGRLVRGDVADILAEVRREYGGDLEVAGPNLAAQFIRRGLVDEFRPVIHPVVIGGGTPYWPALDSPLELRLVERHTFASGVEARSYVPA